MREERMRHKFKKLLFILLALGLGAVGLFAFNEWHFERKVERLMAASPKEKREPRELYPNWPACVKTEFLHVRIAGHEYKLPRSLVLGLRGDEVRKSAPKHGLKLCQHEGEVWDVSYIHMVLLPSHCETKNKCDGAQFYLDIDEFAKREPNAPKVFPDTKEELLEKCRPPVEPMSEFHAKVRSQCNFVCHYDGLRIRFGFRGGI